MGGERLELGGEGEGRTDAPEKQRLLPEVIARQAEHTGAPVPQREGEHADHGLERGLEAPGLDGREQHLGIGMAAQLRACAQQLTSKCRMIVDLAPEHETVAALGRDHGLVTVGRQIDDREPPVSQRRPACGIRPHARTVRAAVAQGVRHAPDHLAENGRGEAVLRIKQPDDAAHP